jgi:cytochrome c oxidase subunit 4
MIQQAAASHSRARIGNRDVVGYGANGEASYADRIMFPFPAIRFKENTPDVLALREKEKGDWKKLSIEEKKALYRASFCQTYAEMRAPTGEWKSIIGVGLGLVGLSWWMYIWMKLYVYPPLPKSFELENRQAQLQRMIDLRVDQITGLTSEYDYENNKWKK